MRWLERLWGITAVIAAFAVAGCSSYASVCEAQMDCLGGNSADFDACEISYESQEDVASLSECSDRWADYVDCIDERARCQGGEVFDRSECDNRRDDYLKCIN